MSAPCPGIPARLDWIVIDGRSPGSRTCAGHLPSREIAVARPWGRGRDRWSDRPRDRQSAYSCGGSHGLGPSWVVLTVFPIIPLGVLFGEPSPRSM